ncbi:HAD-like domain-containing protein [Paraphysoderma sedebokerense]|nr:HAD-like domain-containing protein [Paraphysoderma sedebokerense]
MRHKVRLVTFDAFSTLFRPTASVGELYSRAASEFISVPSPITLQTSFIKAITLQRRKHPNYGRYHQIPLKQWWAEVVSNTFRNGGVEIERFGKVQNQVFENIWTGFEKGGWYEVYPDTIPTLKSLHERKMALAVVSNSDSRLVDILKSLDLSSYFSLIISSHESGFEKPDTKIFSYTISQFNSTFKSIPGDTEKNKIAANEVLHIGDDLEKDYTAALTAGCQALLLSRSTFSLGSSLSEDPTTVNLASNSSIPRKPKVNVIQSLKEIENWIPT